MLLTTAYFPPIEYFALLARCSVVYMEACENYQKQSYRNRCYILSSHGKEMLQVPVIHEGGRYELPIREIRVDYSTPWVIRTQRCIDAAYSSSPFFEHYRDSLYAIMDSHPETLWQLNMDIVRFFCAKIGIAPVIEQTRDFELYAEEDYRTLIHPKRPNTILADLGLARPYWQVFGFDSGFTSGLSIMDLLFNEGPECICYLK